MGTDIHMHLQVRDGKTDQWRTVLPSIFHTRNYLFFAWLAGIRSEDGEPGVCNPGLPRDTHLDSDNYINGYWIGDYGYGWLSVDGFLDAKLPARSDDICANALIDTVSFYRDALKALLGSFHNTEYRIIFGFDS